MQQAYDISNPQGLTHPAAHAAALPAGSRTSRTIEIGQTVADVERHLILATLDYCQGNRTHAAKILAISIRTLRNKLNEYAGAGFLIPEPGQFRTGAPS